jgi:hypothetical protein
MKKYTLKKVLALLLFVSGSCVVSGCYGPPPTRPVEPRQQPEVQKIAPDDQPSETKQN